MADPIVMILGFNGDPDDLREHFERARRLWIEAQEGDYGRPVLYVACKTHEGIAIVTGWETDAAHKAFARGMRSQLKAVGMSRPDRHEHLRIETLGWDDRGVALPG
jgi:hypothetical protein